MIIGGRDSNRKCLYTVEKFDLNDLKTSIFGALKTARAGAGTMQVAGQNSLYVFSGGNSSYQCVESIEICEDISLTNGPFNIIFI